MNLDITKFNINNLIAFDKTNKLDYDDPLYNYNPRYCHDVIYFLLYQKEVVYIGETGNLGHRLNGHRKKQYDSVRYINRSECPFIEKELIFHFQPKYNYRFKWDTPKGYPPKENKGDNMPIADDLLKLKNHLEKSKTESARIEGQIEQLEQQRVRDFACGTDEEAETYIKELEADIARLEAELAEGVQTVKAELGW